ncbi:MAG: hypothetical protein IKJ58_11170 [Akkermansia sp.]|nr:hypothetical protein [Akkermansia sp.]
MRPGTYACLTRGGRADSRYPERLSRFVRPVGNKQIRHAEAGAGIYLAHHAVHYPAYYNLQHESQSDTQYTDARHQSQTTAPRPEQPPRQQNGVRPHAHRATMPQSDD